MENPAAWKRAELVISGARREWDMTNSAGAAGLSLSAFTALRPASSSRLREAGEPALGWDGLRALSD